MLVRHHAIPGLLMFLLLTAFSLPVLADDGPAKADNDAAAVADKTESDGDEQEADKTKFVRLTHDEDGELLTMDTAIVSYVGKNKDGQDVRVDLIGAIHIADTSYYRQLNKEFANYDSLLYELVAPKGTRPQGGTAGAYSPIASWLELDDQIRVIDYELENFVHADMTWDELVESMEKRNESWLAMVFRMVGQSIGQQSQQQGKGGGGGDGELLGALLFAENRALVMKQMMASQFTDLDKSMKWLEGPDGSTLITERNKVALSVLREQLNDGKQRVGIFYGAGHLPDMERRLIDEFQLKRGQQRWLVAWRLKEGTKRGEGRKKRGER